ncbi:MAG: sulfotransferase family protein [Alphaproteobacteria bacterium]
MPLQVIGAGLPRSGTLSLKHALEELGYGRCHHMDECWNSPERQALWKHVFDEDYQDWDKIFEGYGAAVDAPACYVFDKLASYYPRAKVVLTTRDPQAWLKSLQSAMFNPDFFARMARSPISQMLEPMFRYHMRQLGAPMPEGVTALAAPPPPGALLAEREAHHADVMRKIPADRLLVFDVKEGWEPLCKFLGKPMPRTPFPRVNSSAEFQTNFALPG